jgi:hypothetical protein
MCISTGHAAATKIVTRRVSSRTKPAGIKEGVMGMVGPTGEPLSRSTPPSAEQLQDRVTTAQGTVNSDKSALQAVLGTLAQDLSEGPQIDSLTHHASLLQAQLNRDEATRKKDQTALDQVLQKTLPQQTDQAIEQYGEAVAHAPGAPSFQTAATHLQKATFNEEVLTYEQTHGLPSTAPGSKQWQQDAQELLGDTGALQAVGKAVAGRHLGESTAGGLDLQHFQGTPSQKLDLLKTVLLLEPAQAGAILQEPAVQQLLQTTVESVATTYKQSATNKPYAAPLAASSSLAAAVQGLPPAYAAEILQKGMKTIQEIASYSYQFPAGPWSRSRSRSVPPGLSAFDEIFANLSTAVGAAGSPVLAEQVARSYTKTLIASAHPPDPSAFLPTLHAQGPTASVMGAVSFAMAQGASPDLALALAAQAQRIGQTAIATSIVTKVTAGLRQEGARIHKLQGAIAQDISQFNSVAEPIVEAQGLLTPQELQKVLTDYQPVKGTLSKMLKDVGALNSMVEQLQGLPPSMQGFVQGLLSSVGENKDNQEAVTIIARAYPNSVAGALGKPEPGSTVPSPSAGGFDAATFAFWTDHAVRDGDMLSALAGAYLTANVLPAFGQLVMTHNSPQAVDEVKSVLTDLRGKAAGLFGLPQGQADDGVNELRAILQKALDGGKGQKSTMEAVAAQVKELNELPFSEGPGGVAFKTLGALLGGFALVGGGLASGTPPSTADMLNFGSNLFGTTAAVGDLLATVAGNESLARVSALFEGLGGSLDTATFIASGFLAIGQNKKIDGALSFLGGLGSAAATVGSRLGIADLTPLGIGLAIVSSVFIYAHTQREQNDSDSEAAKQVLMSAGLPESLAETLSSNGLRNTLSLQSNLNLSPANIRALANLNPAIFTDPASTQGFISIAKAVGVSGTNTLTFAKAVADDAKNQGLDYLTMFRNWNFELAPVASQSGKDADLFGRFASAFPTAGKLVATPSAAARLQAELDYSAVAGDIDRASAIAKFLQQPPTQTPSLGPLGSIQFPSQDYRAQMINLMQQNGSLDGWLKMIAGFHNQVWSQAAQVAVQDATSGKNPLITLTPAESQDLKALS